MECNTNTHPYFTSTWDLPHLVRQNTVKYNSTVWLSYWSLPDSAYQKVDQYLTFRPKTNSKSVHFDSDPKYILQQCNQGVIN